MEILEFRGRPIVLGRARGEAVVVNAISFYGDVNPDNGVLSDGRVISGKILVARRSRGSTVGSYVLYSLKENSVAPLAIIMEKSEPIIVAGAVIASIPLVDRVDKAFFSLVSDGDLVEVSEEGIVRLVRRS